VKLFGRSKKHRVEGYAENDGVRLRFEAHGQGSPLLLHHGFGGRGRDWADAGYVTQLVEAGFRVIMMDARGHGLSDKPHEVAAYATEARVRDIVAVLDAAEEEQVDYWGYSMGGWIGFALLHAYPTRVRHFVTGAAAPAPDAAFQEEAHASADALAAGDVNRLSQGDMSQDVASRMVAANDMQALAALQLATIDGLHADLATLRTPSLHYVGEFDPLLEQSRHGAEQMPISQFEVLEGSDHLTAFLRSRQILALVLQFLDKRR
jgi:pimeloyl-ACP methyl ester carboxylesterase